MLTPRCPSEVEHLAMGYRLDSDSAHEFHKRQQRDSSTLLRCGLPSEIFNDPSKWWYLLEHGYDHESGWNPDWITKEQSERLREFLISEYKSEGLELLREIERTLRPDL